MEGFRSPGRRRWTRYRSLCITGLGLFHVDPSSRGIALTVVDRSPVVLKACTELYGYLAQVVAGQKLPLQTVECDLKRTFPIRTGNRSRRGRISLIVVQECAFQSSLLRSSEAVETEQL